MTAREAYIKLARMSRLDVEDMLGPGAGLEGTSDLETQLSSIHDTAERRKNTNERGESVEMALSSRIENSLEDNIDHGVANDSRTINGSGDIPSHGDVASIGETTASKSASNSNTIDHGGNDSWGNMDDHEIITDHEDVIEDKAVISHGSDAGSENITGHESAHANGETEDYGNVDGQGFVHDHGIMNASGNVNTPGTVPVEWNWLCDTLVKAAYQNLRSGQNPTTNLGNVTKQGNANAATNMSIYGNAHGSGTANAYGYVAATGNVSAFNNAITNTHTPDNWQWLRNTLALANALATPPDHSDRGGGNAQNHLTHGSGSGRGRGCGRGHQGSTQWHRQSPESAARERGGHGNNTSAALDHVSASTFGNSSSSLAHGQIPGSIPASSFGPSPPNLKYGQVPVPPPGWNGNTALASGGIDFASTGIPPALVAFNSAAYDSGLGSWTTDHAIGASDATSAGISVVPPLSGSKRASGYVPRRGGSGRGRLGRGDHKRGNFTHGGGFPVGN